MSWAHTDFFDTLTIVENFFTQRVELETTSMRCKEFKAPVVASYVPSQLNTIQSRVTTLLERATAPCFTPFLHEADECKPHDSMQI